MALGTGKVIALEQWYFFFWFLPHYLSEVHMVVAIDSDFLIVEA
jgi:hypothetical protein